MVTEQRQRTVATGSPRASDLPSDARPRGPARGMTGPDRTDLVGWLLLVAFGAVQVAIGARIVLLLVDARSAGGALAGILGVGTAVVEPFERVLRSDSLHASGPTLDPSAVVAIVTVTLLEAAVLFTLGILRRAPG